MTRGAQSVEPGETVEPLGAPAWGVGRVLRHQELLSHPGKLIDLDPGAQCDDARQVEARALLRELLTDDEEEIALRGAGRLTSRIRQAEQLTHPFRCDCAPTGTTWSPALSERSAACSAGPLSDVGRAV